MIQTYFTHPNYLVVQCWVHAMCLSPDTINQTGLHTYHYGNFFKEWVGCMPLGASCTHLVAIIDFSNAAMPFIIPVYLAL